MYTVLLVDDEQSVLEIIYRSVSWQNMGVDTVLTASDGEGALKIIENHHVDLLVTDIRMPRMNGMELIRYVRQVCPDTHCVLLSAYGEFLYAKEAISLGVENYLLKPVAQEEIEATIEKALDNIYKHQNNSERLLLNNTLQRWLVGTISSEELGERASYLGINLYLSCYCVLCMVKRSPSVTLMPFYSACVETLSHNIEVNHLWDENGRYVFILGGKTIDPEALGAVLESLAKTVGVHGSVAAAFGVPVLDADSLPLSYRRACEIIGQTDLVSTGKELILKGHIESRTGFLEENLRIVLYEEDEQIRQKLRGELAVKLLTTENGSVNKTLAYLMRVFSGILLYEFPLRTDIQERLSKIWSDQNTGRDEALCTVTKVIEQADVLYQDIFAGMNFIVQRMIKHIRISLGEGLSLKVLGTQLDMNPAYLGHLFKQETGIFFNDYVIRLRIARSLALLGQKNIKIKDVAVQMGFFSTSYFEKCFKKQMGISPLKYRLEPMDEVPR